MLFDFVQEYILKGWFLLKKKKTCEIITKDFLVKSKNITNITKHEFHIWKKKYVKYMYC